MGRRRGERSPKIDTWEFWGADRRYEVPVHLEMYQRKVKGYLAVVYHDEDNKRRSDKEEYRSDDLNKLYRLVEAELKGAVKITWTKHLTVEVDEPNSWGCNEQVIGGGLSLSVAEVQLGRGDDKKDYYRSDDKSKGTQGKPKKSFSELKVTILDTLDNRAALKQIATGLKEAHKRLEALLKPKTIEATLANVKLSNLLGFNPLKKSKKGRKNV